MELITAIVYHEKALERKNTALTIYYSHTFPGNHLVNIFIIGSYNKVSYYKGITWENDSSHDLLNFGFHLKRVDLNTTNMATACGKLEIGKRY